MSNGHFLRYLSGQTLINKPRWLSAIHTGCLAYLRAINFLLLRQVVWIAEIASGLILNFRSITTGVGAHLLGVH